jgi:hypothetical protein
MIQGMTSSDACTILAFVYEKFNMAPANLPAASWDANICKEANIATILKLNSFYFL